MIKRQTVVLKNINPITRAEGLCWPGMQARTPSRVKKTWTRHLRFALITRSSWYTIVRFVVRHSVHSMITNEDDKCFSDRQLFPRGALSAYNLSSICRCIAFIEYFQQLRRGAEWNHSLWREKPFVTSINGAFESSKTRSLTHWTTVKRVAVSNAPHSVDELSSCASTRQSARGVTHYVLKENNFGKLDSCSW